MTKEVGQKARKKSAGSSQHSAAALKHGGYSGMTLLPGESASAFKKLHNAIVKELNPRGALEKDIITSIARLTWRKQNLLTYRLAVQAQIVASVTASEFRPNATDVLDASDPEKPRAALEEVEKQVEQDLGRAARELLEIGELAEIDHLLKELSVIDRLDGMIDRGLKRLLFVRGIKSLVVSSSAAPSPKKLRGH